MIFSKIVAFALCERLEIMRVYLSTGDTSAEPHALGFINACKEIEPGCEFSVMGGDILRSGGVDITFDSTEIKVMGFVAIIKHLPKIRKIFYDVLDYIHNTKPDVVVLVDYPGFHLRLAKKIKKKFPELPIIYYITPQVWAWHQSRVEIIKKYVDWAMCILPFEEKWFVDHGVKSEYVGSPVLDGVRNADPQALKEYLGISQQKRVVSIFAGSRRKELEYILKPMLGAVELVREKFTEVEFVLSVAPGMRRNIDSIRNEIPEYIQIVEGQSHEILAGSDFVFAKSGTTTLEAALIGTPMIVAYRGDWLSAIIAKFLKRLNNLPFISLPNIIAGKEVVPELLQEECSARALAEFAIKVLGNKGVSDNMKIEFRKIRDIVGEEDSGIRAARSFFGYLSRRNF